MSWHNQLDRHLAADAIAEDDINSQPDAKAAQNTVAESQWWSGMFKRAGYMGTMQEEAQVPETELGQQPQVGNRT